MSCSTSDTMAIDALCQSLASPHARTRYGAAKKLVLLSQTQPATLYPFFDFFARLREGESRILRWNAARILGNLARVDTSDRIEEILDYYLAPITGTDMIAAANAMRGAAAIALAKPHLAARIATAILKVRHARYATPACCQVGAGHAIVALDRFYQSLRNKKAVLAFVESQRHSPRPATRRKAEKFLKKWAPR